MDIDLNLPEAPPIPIRCEADYYGASRLIAQSLGLAQPPLSSSTWMHGCDVYPIPRTVFAPQYRTPNQTHLVGTVAQQTWWRANGFAKAIAAGCPFIYTSPSGRQRIPGSVLAMPSHGLPGTLRDDEQTERWFANVAGLRANHALVVVCLHSDDTELLKPYLDRYQLPSILGAKVHSLCLPRIRAMFDIFEFVVADVQGSHFPYAAWSGCKLALLEPLYERRWEHVKDHVHMQKNPQMKENIAFQQTDYIRAQSPFLFADDLSKATCPQDWAAELLGASSKRTPQEMARLLGWSADDPAFAGLPYEDVAGWLGAHNPNSKLVKAEDQRRELKNTVNALEKQQAKESKFVNSVSGRIGRGLYSIEKRFRSIFGGNK